jgi:metallo-beta-lactamase family protein
MCTGGRIRHHFKHNIWRDNCHVVIIGFQARGTTGRALIDGTKELNLWGETVRVNAKIHTLGGFSAHADQPELIGWYGRFNNRPSLVFVHGEPQAADELKKVIDAKYNTGAHIAKFGETMQL